MRKIEAMIRPQKLEEVKNALVTAGVKGMTISEVRGFGDQEGFVDHFHAGQAYIDLLPKIELKIILPNEQVAPIVQVLMETAYTGESGDGKIFVSTIDEVYQISTGARDVLAL